MREDAVIYKPSPYTHLALLHKFYTTMFLAS